MLADLTGQSARLHNDVATMPCTQLQIPIRRFQLQLAEPETGDGRSMVYRSVHDVDGGLSSPIGVSETVPLWYDPAAPETVYLESLNGLRALSVLAAGLGLVLIGTAEWRARGRWRRGR